MGRYNWQQVDWPDFKYNLSRSNEVLDVFEQETSHVSGILKAIPQDAYIEAMINLMVAEALKTSEIEGEYLQRSDVLSSIRNNLGLNSTLEKVIDKRARGAAELMVAVRKSFAQPLTKEMLFDWHKMLLRQSSKIKVGAWRTHIEPMRVISGAVGKEKVHFEAPPSSRVPKEMEMFIDWFNNTAPGGSHEIKKSSVRSAIAHLYFESIHPFEDGNGRIGRAIAEKALSQGVGRPVLLSLSQAIEAKKKIYYEQLQKAQCSNRITSWINYFANTVLEAQLLAKVLIELSLKKAKFFDKYKNCFNPRQEKVIKKMLEAEPKGFEGGMSAKKYMSITKTSKATATRDLQALADLGALTSQGGGRSLNYAVNFNN